MSVIARAMTVQAQAALQAEEQVGKCLDKKDKELETQSKINDLKDLHEDFAADNWLSVGEKGALVREAGKAGVGLGADQFTEINKPLSVGHSGVWLKSDDSEDTAAKDRKSEYDRIGKKFDRALEQAQGASGQTDLKMNLAMNKLSQALQNANTTLQTLKEVERGVAPQA